MSIKQFLKNKNIVEFVNGNRGIIIDDTIMVIDAECGIIDGSVSLEKNSDKIVKIWSYECELLVVVENYEFYEDDRLLLWSAYK